MITAACRPTARVLWQHAWALPPVCSTWLVSHARAADTCRAARARDSSGRRGTSSGRVNWRPLTRTCGSGCCAPSHLRRTQQLASQNAERIEPSGFGSAEESLQVRRRRFAHRVRRRPAQGAITKTLLRWPGLAQPQGSPTTRRASQVMQTGCRPNSKSGALGRAPPHGSPAPVAG
eukprot:scaffold26033_cov78-Phaeocystis_antarctica.AAC.1